MNDPLTERLVTASLDSPLGALLAGATGDGICLLEFAEPARREAQLAALRRQFAGPVESGRHDHIDRLRQELAEYFAGTRRDFTVPVVFPGTPFQRRDARRAGGPVPRRGGRSRPGRRRQGGCRKRGGLGKRDKGRAAGGPRRLASFFQERATLPLGVKEARPRGRYIR